MGKSSFFLIFSFWRADSFVLYLKFFLFLICVSRNHVPIPLWKWLIGSFVCCIQSIRRAAPEAILLHFYLHWIRAKMTICDRNKAIFSNFSDVIFGWLWRAIYGFEYSRVDNDVDNNFNKQMGLCHFTLIQNTKITKFRCVLSKPDLIEFQVIFKLSNPKKNWIKSYSIWAYKSFDMKLYETDQRNK